MDQGIEQQGRLTVLVVDDEEQNVALLRRLLRREYNVLCAHTGEDAVELLRATPHLAVVITDQRMPGIHGVELLREAVKIVPDAVRIIVSGYTDTSDILDAINHGHVDRFIVKPIEADRFANTIKDALEIYKLKLALRAANVELRLKNEQLIEHERHLEALVEQRTAALRNANAALEEANAHLRELTLRDGLTGLYNHRYFQERLQAEVARSRRHNHQVGLLFIDIDYFKRYNDTHGHPAGDHLLKKVARLLTVDVRAEDVIARLRASDVVARYGGEEFAIILPETHLGGAKSIAERIHKAVREHDFPGRETQPFGTITVSIGVAAFPDSAPDAAALLDAADRAMYRAKENGRDRVCVGEPPAA